MRRASRAGLLHGRRDRGSVRQGRRDEEGNEEIMAERHTIHVDVVSAEAAIYSGEAEFVVLPGEAGELGIYPKHTPLITRIKPGSVRIKPAGGGEEELGFVAAGILRGQPGGGTGLADTPIRARRPDGGKAARAPKAPE